MLTIPEEYGGFGLSKASMCVVSEELSRGYIGVGSLGTRSEIAAELILCGGTEEQKKKWLPRLASAETLPTAVFTEPNTGSDLGSLRTRAERDGDVYRIHGNKTGITHGARSDMMTLLARTDPKEPGYKGLSMFLVDMQQARGQGMEIKPIRTMMNHSSCEVFFDDLRIPASALVGEEGKGFRYILSGMNAERMLIASECVGDAKWFIEKAAAYSAERTIFGGPIGKNQGVQFPIAKAYADMRAAELMLRARLATSA